MQVLNKLHAFIWTSVNANNCNTYLIDGPTRILIDPGHAAYFDHVVKGLNETGIKPQDIGLVICTHAHPDHMEAIKLFSPKSALFTLHYQEWQFLKTISKKAGSYFKMDFDSFEPSFFLKAGNLAIKNLNLTIFHVPGHSPGSVAIYWPENKVLFTGDLIFKEGLGRTDIPGGNGGLLKKSILSLKELDIEFLLPGHGEMITGADEIKENFKELENYWFKYV
jgi:glyoxylase-like metal-dependent hydrolase (beta-lactamase superfamily II)